MRDLLSVVRPERRRHLDSIPGVWQNAGAQNQVHAGAPPCSQRSRASARRSEAVVRARFHPGAASSQVNTKDITELEKFVKDAKPRFLFYKDGAAPTNQPTRTPPVPSATGRHLSLLTRVCRRVPWMPGELCEAVEGINAPAILRCCEDYLPEGMLEQEEVVAEDGDGDEED